MLSYYWSQFKITDVEIFLIAVPDEIDFISVIGYDEAIKEFTWHSDWPITWCIQYIRISDMKIFRIIFLFSE